MEQHNGVRESVFLFRRYYNNSQLYNKACLNMNDMRNLKTWL